MYFSVRVANQRSTWLSQDAEVGVKCTRNPGCVGFRAIAAGDYLNQRVAANFKSY